MRLLFVSEATKWTGGTNQILLTAGELSRRGHSINIACSPGSELETRAKAIGIATSPLNIRQEYDFFSSIQLKRIARTTSARLVHAHHPRAHGICLIAKLFGLKQPLVVTRRVLFPIKKNLGSQIKYRSSFIEHFIAISNAIVRELHKTGIPSDRVSLIPSAVELKPWIEARNLNRSAENEGFPRIGMVGNFSDFKGHQFFIRAAKRVVQFFPKAGFVLVGRDTEKLAEMIGETGLKANFEILGERKDVPKILPDFHLFVMPSLQEGLGSALIEAQVAGVPAIGTNVGGIPDIIIPGKTGVLVPPADPEALAEAIIGSLRNYSKALEMASRGQKNAENLFGLPSVGDRLEKLYRSLIS